MPANEQRGVIDLADRLMRHRLENPDFKDNLREVLNNLDPEAARGLARGLLWTDMEVILGLLGSLPRIVNAGIVLADEMLLQVDEKFPSELLKGFLQAVLAEVDAETLKRVVSGLTQLSGELVPVLEEFMAGAGLKSQGE